MGGAKRFLEEVAQELGTDNISDSKVVTEAKKRLEALAATVEQEGAEKSEEEEIKEATEKLRAIMLELNVKVDYFLSDWKDQGGHLEELTKFIREHRGWYPYWFQEGYNFEHGSGDDLITVYLTKPDVPMEKVERIADLIYNLGATFSEWE